MKSLTLITTLSMLALGCTGTEEVNCTENPSERACIEACSADPTLSHCSDAGATDSGPADSSVDAGPDATLPCGVECTGDTPLCNTVSTECVQCLGPDDCTSMGVNTMCSDTGSCVECLGDLDCDGAGASVCATDGIMAGSCVACTAGNDDDCAGILGDEGQTLNVCDDSAGSGVCVECNAGDETACGANVCDVLEQTCTDDVPVGTTPTCGSCVSDSQCATGQVCAPTTFGGEDAGYYCLWRKDAPDGPAGFCVDQAPFVTDANITTIGNEEMEICRLRLTTCAAYGHFSGPGLAEDTCATEPESNDNCGLAELEDGICVFQSPSISSCSTRCTNDVDCVFDDVEYDCLEESPRVCGFTPL